MGTNVPAVVVLIKVSLSVVVSTMSVVVSTTNFKFETAFPQ